MHIYIHIHIKIHIHAYMHTRIHTCPAIAQLHDALRHQHPGAKDLVNILKLQL